MSHTRPCKFVSAGLALLATVFFVTACDKSTPASGSGSAAAQQAATKKEDAEEQWFDKVSAFVAISNQLHNDPTATNPTIQQWRARDAAKAQAGDFKSIRTDTHRYNEHFVKKMEEALAMPASTPEIDAAAKTLLATTKDFVPQWKALTDYNTSKKYEDDKGAKGRELLKTYLEGIRKLDADQEAFANAVHVAAQQSHEKRLAIYRKEGKQLEAATLEALNAAQQVVDVFSDEKDLKNPAKIEKANALVAEMEKSIETIRAEHPKRKEAKDDMPRIDNYISVTNDLQQFAGAYREARKSPKEFNRVIESYNSAIENYNRMN